MRNPCLDDTARRNRLLLALLAALGLTLVWWSPVPVAEAKGPVKFTFCGKRACVGKSSPRFTAAMLYGGSSHAGPVCRTRVHTVTAAFPRVEAPRRFLLVASRGLVGEQFKRGHVWWRKVRGSRKTDLIRAVRHTGRGFRAAPEIRIGMFSFERTNVGQWHLRDDGSWSGQLTCS